MVININIKMHRKNRGNSHDKCTYRPQTLLALTVLRFITNDTHIYIYIINTNAYEHHLTNTARTVTTTGLQNIQGVRRIHIFHFTSF